MLNRGTQVKGSGGASVNTTESLLFLRILKETVLKGGPRRAWFTLSLLATTLLKRPSAFKEAVSFAIVHKAFQEYMETLCGHLDFAIAQIERNREAGTTAAV